MADISLTASMRTNLLSLQNTQSLMDQTQERLSTGKKVNSAIDNPSSYYTARSLNNRAGDLNALLDSMGQGIQTIKAANEGIESITDFVEQAKALINTARDTSASKIGESESTGTFAASGEAKKNVEFTLTIDGAEEKINVENVGTDSGTKDLAQLVTNLKNALQAKSATFDVVAKDGQLVVSNTDKTVAWSLSGEINGLTIAADVKAAQPNDRTSAQDQYNEILNQIDMLAKDSGYKGVNLLQAENLTVNFNEDRTSSLLVQGKNADVEGLKLPAGEDWDNADNVALETALNSVDDAINTLRNWASEFGNNYSIVQSRESFTENLINVLTEGADKLTLADMNEESANMLALQTRQQLAINSLSLASQAAQSVLQLF